MEYLGHYDAGTGAKQLLKEHLDHVASLAAQFAASFDAEELGEIAGRYHDVGKYSARFQEYLRGVRSSGGAIALFGGMGHCRASWRTAGLRWSV